MPGIEWNREQRSSAPLECEFSFAALLPHFGRAAAIDDVINLFVQMPLGVQRSRAWHFDDVHAPEMFGAEELNRRAPAAEPLPRLQREVLDFMHTDVPMDRNALCFHEEIIGGLGIFPFAETSLLPLFWLTPFEELRARFNAHIANPPFRPEHYSIAQNYETAPATQRRRPAKCPAKDPCNVRLHSQVIDPWPQSLKSSNLLKIYLKKTGPFSQLTYSHAGAA